MLTYIYALPEVTTKMATRLMVLVSGAIGVEAKYGEPYFMVQPPETNLEIRPLVQ